MNKRFTIYCHTNKINGKKYVGQTSYTNPKHRWGSNGVHYKPKKKGTCVFFNAIQKYGWDNFEHEVLLTNLTLSEANELEKVIINAWDLTNSNKGYNNKEGGSNGAHTNETKKKISDIKRSQHIKTKGSTDMHWYNNGEEEILSYECPEGWVIGMLYRERYKRGATGKKWFNNGEKQILAFVCPEGYVKGTLPIKNETRIKMSMKAKNRTLEHRKKLSNALKGNKTRGSKDMHWYNNGIINTLCLEKDIPEGFKKGRLAFKYKDAIRGLKNG